MKEGLIFEEDELRYYKNDRLYHAGVVEQDGAFYYINSRGRAVKGQYVIHSEMTNDLLKRGTYTFGDDYKMVEGSYIAPKKSKKKKKKKKKSSSRKQPWYRSKTVRRIFIGLLLLTVMIVIAALMDQGQGSTSSTDKETTEPNTEVRVNLPAFTEDVLLCSPASKQLYDGKISVDAAADTGDPYRAFTFNYRIEGASGVLFLSQDPELTDASEYVLAENNNKVLIHNLKPDAEYYYKVTVADQDYYGSFKTAPSTRFVYIPGAVNTRDIGGYKTQNGKTIRQGMIIRGSEIDGLVEISYFVPTDKIKEVQNTFGFVHDMDLRGADLYQGVYTSRLGENVTHIFYGAPQYGQIFNDLYIPTLKTIFTDLADPGKYPMYMHCTYGADRTGTVIFLLQGILNMSEEEMLQEFQRTGLSISGYDKSAFMNIVVEGLQQYAGDTLSEKVVTYMTTVVGLTHEQLDSIRSILLTD